MLGGSNSLAPTARVANDSADMHLRSPPRFLIFTHARHRPPDRYGRSGRSETGAFERELACVREDDRAVTIEMLVKRIPSPRASSLSSLPCAVRVAGGRRPCKPPAVLGSSVNPVIE